MTTQQIQIDFSKTKDIADRGVRRAAVFMGIGINAVLGKERLNYDLTNITQIQLMPSNVSDETHAHFKDEFSIWITGNGFRELIETFKVFLDELHHICLILASSKGILSIEKVKSFDKNFPREGLPQKLSLLNDHFNVSPKYPKYLKTLNKARNCLTHRRGIVGFEDCNDIDVLKINWLGIDIFVEEPNGNKTLMTEIPEGGLFLPEGGSVNLQVVQREKKVNRGDIIKFTPRELAEICHYFLIESSNTCGTAINFAKSIEIPFSEVDQK
jgi:hypothetical protein